MTRSLNMTGCRGMALLSMVVLRQDNINCNDWDIKIEIIRLRSQDKCSPFPSLLPRAESDLAEVISAADREVGSPISTI